MACINFNKRQLQSAALLEGDAVADKSTVKELHMCFNFISELPATCFLQFSSLTFLSLNCNSLASIPSLAGLPGLTELHLANNRIAKIENLEELPNLQFLDLCCNHITCIDNLVENCQLKRLSLSGNMISAIAMAGLPGTMHRLTTLGLYGNQLSDVSLVLKMLSKAPNLSDLTLGCNPLSQYEPLTISSSLLSLPHLTSRQLTQVTHWLSTANTTTDMAVSPGDQMELEQSLQVATEAVHDLHVLKKVISVARILSVLRATCSTLVSIDSEQCNKFVLLAYQPEGVFLAPVVTAAAAAPPT